MLRAKTSFSNYCMLSFFFWFLSICFYLLYTGYSQLESLLGISNMTFPTVIVMSLVQEKAQTINALCRDPFLYEVLQLSVLMQMHPCSQGRLLYHVSSSQSEPLNRGTMETIFLLASVPV